MSLHFKARNVEWAAVETGLGGRLDATNLLPSDVAVITNISLEHTRILGRTINQIAAEKAAIIKPGASAVTAAEPGAGLQVITARAHEVGVPLSIVDADIRFDISSEDVAGQDITLYRWESCLPVRLRVGGRFQARNAAAAFGAVHALRERGVSIEDGSIIAGLEKARTPGRFEIMHRRPLVILDGAHNPDAIGQLVDALRHLVPGRRVVAVFAAMDDKDIDTMAESLRTAIDEVYVTAVPGSERGANLERVAAAFARRVGRVIVDESPEGAYERARSELSDDDVLVVTGSLYHVGFLRQLLLAGSTA